MINLILKLMESEELKTAFLKLANMSISASWLVLAILVLRLVLKKAPQWVNVLLWGIVAVRLICPFTIESALSLIPSTQTIPMNIEMAAKPAIDSGVTVVNSMVNPMIAASFTPNPAASANPLQIWIPLAAVIWTFGMVLMLVYTAISYWRLNRRINTAVLYRDNIFQSENVSSPFVLGIIKPKIYLPFHMNEQDLQHVVAHEQAHIHRKDHWWKPLGFLLLTVHWFNPLMWLAYVLLCRDIELACDEKVIKELNSEQRADYTQALVACSVNRRMIAACPLAFGEVSVKDRVKSVMNYRKPSFWITMTALVACGIASICFLTNPIGDERNSSFLNYKNAISLSAGQDVIPAVHYSSQNEQGSIGIGMVEGDAFARFLGSVGWTEKWMEPSDLSSPGSVAVNVADNLRITVYDRNFAAVEFNDEVCYYRINNSDYEKILELLMPADEERLEKSSETRLDIVLGVATIEKRSDSISLGVFFSEKEYDDITEFKLQNLHNGSWSFITDEEEVNSVLQFLSKVEGINKNSSKGYYGGCYAILAQNGNETIFSIGFGDDESFNYGDYGDGYPARYELDGITKEEVIRFLSQYDTSGVDWGLSSSVLQATVLEIHDGYFLVEPVQGSWELSSAGRIEVPMKNMEPSPEPQVGDILEIEYDGQLMETYPARISNPYSIKVIEEAESWDRIPMVMVNGELYLDTGKESSVMARCGMMDGEITSQVDGSKSPTVDDQSNFGTGYGYQYGAIEGTIEINMNGKWWIFATEEVRREIQFPQNSDGTSNKDILKIFSNSVSGDNTIIVTDHVYADDSAYGLDGVIQYADETGSPWKLAFIRDGVVHPVGQNWGTDYIIASRLKYLGNGTVQVYVENKHNGDFYECIMTFSQDESGNTNFKSESKEVEVPKDIMELMIDPIVPVTVVDLITGEQKFVNSNPSIRAIQSLIASEWWAEGNPACDYDFKITVNEEDFMYHSDCGTFTDLLGDRCITLDESQKGKINELFGVVQKIDFDS